MDSANETGRSGFAPANDRDQDRDHGRAMEIRKESESVGYFFIRLLAFAGGLGLFLALQKTIVGWPLSLQQWNFVSFSASKYGGAFASYLCVLVLLRCSRKTHVNKLILLAASAAWGACFYGPGIIAAYAAAVVLYPVLSAKIRFAYKAAAFFCGGELFLWVALEMLFPDHPSAFWYCYVGANLCLLRLLLYARAAPERGGLSRLPDYLLYLFSPPYFLVFPHIVILPSYEYFTTSLRTGAEIGATLDKGVKCVWKGSSQLCVAAVFISLYIHRNAQLELLFQILPVTHVLILLPVVLSICGYGNFLHGLLLGVGYDIKSPFNSPFLATNIVDFCSRILIYSRELLLELLYFPCILLFRSLQDQTRTILSMMVTISLGGLLYSFSSMGFEFCQILNNRIHGPMSVVSGFGAIFEIHNNIPFLIFHKELIRGLAVNGLIGILFGLQILVTQARGAIDSGSRVPFSRRAFLFAQTALMALLLYMSMNFRR